MVQPICLPKLVAIVADNAEVEAGAVVNCLLIFAQETPFPLKWVDRVAEHGQVLDGSDVYKAYCDKCSKTQTDKLFTRLKFLHHLP